MWLFNADHALCTMIEDDLRVCTHQARCPKSAGDAESRGRPARCTSPRPLSVAPFWSSTRGPGLVRPLCNLRPWKRPPSTPWPGRPTSSRRSIRTGGWRCGTSLLSVNYVVLQYLSFGRVDGVLGQQRYVRQYLENNSAHAVEALAISRQTPRHSANGGVKKCDRPGSSEYSLCRFSATWRASLSGMNGSLSLWN